MFNEEDEENDDVPYGLRVGNGKNVGSDDDDDDDNDDDDSGKVGKGTMSSPPPPLEMEETQQQQMMMEQEKLKGATSSLSSTANINNSSSSSTVEGTTTKKVVMKGGQFQQPSLTTTPTPATFKKGMMEGTMGKKGVFPTTTKISIPIQKMSPLVNKTPLLQPPSPLSSRLSNEIIINTAQSQSPPPPPPPPSSPSVLKSIDKNKEEIAQTKSWIKNEKRLDDVRKKVVEIQGGTIPTSRVGGGGGDRTLPFQFQFVAKAKVTTNEGDSMKKSIWSLLPKQSNNTAETTDAVEEATIFEEVSAGKKAEEGEATVAVAASAAVNAVAKKVGEEPIVAEVDAAINESTEDWIQEQNQIAQQRTAARMARQKRAKQKEAVEAAAAMSEEEEEAGLEEMVAKSIETSFERLTAEEADLIRQARLDEPNPKGQTLLGKTSEALLEAMTTEEAKMARNDWINNPTEQLDSPHVEAEAKVVDARLDEATKQSNVDNTKMAMEMEKPRSEQIPSGEYWLAEQNRGAEERQKVRLAKDAASNQLKGSDRAIGWEQPDVPSKKMPTPKKVEVANGSTGKRMKGESLKGNKPPFPTQPFMKQKTLNIERPKVVPAVSSLPLTKGPKSSTTMRGSSNEKRMIEKGFVPFQGTTTQDGVNEPLKAPLNVPKVITPMIPINKIEPSVASQMIAPTMPSKENESRSLDLAGAEDYFGSLGDIDVSSLPVLRVGNRIRSSVHGTTHQVLLILPKEDGEYELLPSLAKRPWTMAELSTNVPSKVLAFEEQQSESAFDELIPPEPWEVDYNAKSVRRYWEVEIHCNKKFQQKKELYKRLQIQALHDRKQKEEDGRSGGDGADVGVSFAIRVADVAVSKFYEVYPDDGSGGTNEDDIIPEYGLFGQDVWNTTIELGHDWLVYESKLGANELTLLDAMMVSNCNWALVISSLCTYLTVFLLHRHFSHRCSTRLMSNSSKMATRFIISIVSSRL